MSKPDMRKEIVSFISVFALSALIPTISGTKVLRANALLTLTIPALENASVYSRTIVSGIFLAGIAANTISCHNENASSYTGRTTKISAVKNQYDERMENDPILNLQPAHIWVKFRDKESLDYIPDSL